MAYPSTVLLGPILFTDREVPDTMPWGGAQKLVIHKLLGGTRVIDAMGPDPRAIEWKGRFQGPTASIRARAVDALKDSGAQVPLQWGSFAYTVVVAHFHPVYKHEWEVTYEIGCEVVTSTSASTAPSLGSAVTADASSAAAVNTNQDAAASIIAGGGTP